jgi:hypothetical protein
MGTPALSRISVTVYYFPTGGKRISITLRTRQAHSSIFPFPGKCGYYIVVPEILATY